VKVVIIYDLKREGEGEGEGGGGGDFLRGGFENIFRGKKNLWVNSKRK